MEPQPRESSTKNDKVSLDGGSHRRWPSASSFASSTSCTSPSSSSRCRQPGQGLPLAALLSPVPEKQERPDNPYSSSPTLAEAVVPSADTAAAANGTASALNCGGTSMAPSKSCAQCGRVQSPCWRRGPNRTMYVDSLSTFAGGVGRKHIAPHCVHPLTASLSSTATNASFFFSGCATRAVSNMPVACTPILLPSR